MNVETERTAGHGKLSYVVENGENAMIRHLERGVVVAVLNETSACRELWVDVNGNVERAYQEPAFGVSAQVGDLVLLNTTAVRLGLGTGGTHFVIAVETHSELAPILHEQAGHIMKLRYTPVQMAVHAVEEPSHPMHERMREAESLEGIPVVICELHSMLPAVVMSLQYDMQKGNPRPCKVAYVMTDGGALPLHISQTVAALRQKGLLAGTVTVGHAYGGELEAVNLYSGLLAARHVLGADCIIVAMGPGMVGTGTRYGHTGIEVGQAVNAVQALCGEAIVVPRLSFADARDRHFGVSHHTLTALGRVALAQATIPLPHVAEEQAALIWQQLMATQIHRKHHLVGVSGQSILDASAIYQVPLGTMGRTLQEDPVFFLAAGAAGEWVAQLMKNPPKRYARRVESFVLTAKNC